MNLIILDKNNSGLIFDNKVAIPETGVLRLSLQDSLV